MQYLRILKHGRLVGAVLMSLVVCLAAVTSAEAAKRHNRHTSVRGKMHRVAANSGDDVATSSRYAAIVVDDKTGKVLYAKNAEALRHPASLTKMMTLYILFEELQKKKVALASRFQVSQHAANQAPSKLGLRPGTTIAVEDAIRALVTKSANDVAVIVAENIGGSEDAFAKRMTQTARRIGMRGSTFYNASGLPNAAQYSSARDMVVLGRALQERFPVQYRYFSTRSFTWGNSVIGNHNHLLARLEGVDGIKTGYTEASGFNLVTSIRRDNRHVVAAVMGGSSARARDDHMIKLLGTYLPQASTGSKVSSVFKENGIGRSADASDTFDDDEAPTATASIKTAAIETPAPAPVLPISSYAAPAPASAGPLTLISAPIPAPAPAAPTVSASANPSHQPRIASSDSVPIHHPERETSTSTEHGAAVAMARAILLPDSGRPMRSEATPVRTASVSVTAPVVTRSEEAKPTKPISLADATISSSAMGLTTGSVPKRKVEEPAPAAPAPAAAASPKTSAARAGWMVQIGAFDREDAARSALDKAKGNAGAVLARMEGFTEQVGGGRLWRARFAGFNDQKGADDACKALKRKEFVCLALRQ